MRWDRLFDDLEAQAIDLELQERDALVSELSDGDWAETSWRELAGGRVVFDVRGVGQLAGVVGLVNEQIVQLRGDGVDQVIAAEAVMMMYSAERRADTLSVVAGRLGWGHVLRALRDVAEAVTIRLVDGTSRDGVVDVVGRDFVRLRSESGRDQLITWQAIAVVSARA